MNLTQNLRNYRTVRNVPTRAFKLIFSFNNLNFRIFEIQKNQFFLTQHSQSFAARTSATLFTPVETSFPHVQATSLCVVNARQRFARCPTPTPDAQLATQLQLLPTTSHPPLFQVVHTQPVSATTSPHTCTALSYEAWSLYASVLHTDRGCMQRMATHITNKYDLQHLIVGWQ